VPFELLSPAELKNAEPALAAVSHKLTGGLRLPVTKPAIASCSRRAWRRWRNRSA
jgi:hypothetical protein